MGFYFIICLSLLLVGYILGVNGFYNSLFIYILNPSIITGLISSLFVTVYFYYREKKRNAKVVAPKLNNLLTYFRVYYTKHMLTPKIKPDIIGLVGPCEDAFQYPPSKEINFRALYDRSPNQSVVSHHSYDENKILKGLEKHPHLNMFVYVTNVEIKKIIDDLKMYSHCLDEVTASVLFDLENSQYINLYCEYKRADSGIWKQMTELYDEIGLYGEEAVLNSKHLQGVKYSPANLRNQTFSLMDQKFKYFYEKMSYLQTIYDSKYK